MINDAPALPKETVPVSKRQKKDTGQQIQNPLDKNSATLILKALKLLTAFGFDSLGSWHPPSLTNTKAQNNSVFYSTTDSKLAYKDSGGSVHDLY